MPKIEHKHEYMFIESFTEKVEHMYTKPTTVHRRVYFCKCGKELIKGGEEDA